MKYLGVFALAGPAIVALAACPADDETGPAVATDSTAGDSGTAGGSTSVDDDDDGMPGTDDTTATGTPPGTSEDTGTPDDAGESSESGPTGCAGDAECSGAAPFCSGGECIACAQLPDPDGACEGADPVTPYCAPTGCVECVSEGDAACAGEAPICDTEALSCVGCSDHAQCDISCNLGSGACMDTAPSYWARPDAINCSANADGTFSFPFCQPQEAAAQIVEDGEGRAAIEGTIFISSSDDLEGLDVPAGASIAVLPAEGERPNFGQIFVREPGAQLFIEGVTVTGHVFDVATVGDGGVLWMDRVDMYFNLGYSLDVRGGSEVHLRNTIVGGNGRNSNLRPPVYIEDSTFDAVYTTIAANYASGSEDSLSCDAASTVSVRNSIVVASDSSSINCPGIAVDYSYIDTAGLGGAGNEVNTMVQSAIADWFVNAGGVTGMGIDYGDDFHVTAAGATLFESVGLTEPGDLPFDYDRDPRPVQSGVAVGAGADVP